MSDTTNNFLAFLRYTVAGDACPDDAWEGMDWEGLHAFAVKQALVGVLFRGLERLGSGAGVPRELVLRWYAESNQIRQRNALLDGVAAEVSRRFAADGFRSCVLKGQGNALMYPDPSARTPGDVDIWLEGSRREILAYVRRTWPEAPFQYHHVDYPPVRGVGIEVHFIPSFFSNPLQNRRMQAFFRAHADEQFTHRRELPGGGVVAVPTDAFNRVYQLTHILRHLFDEGVGLRQLLDYYYLLRRGMTEEERRRTSGELRRLGMERFAGALMYVLRQLFALDDGLMVAEPDERLGRVVLGEVLHTGNFGQHEDRFATHGGTGGGFALTVMRRLPYLVRHFPAETLWRPLFLALYPIWKLRYRQ